jgi:Glyoxalase-like domain
VRDSDCDSRASFKREDARPRDRPLSSASVTAKGHAAELDHVLLAVTDLAGAVRAIEDEHGLPAEGGGQHPGWGTANYIVPLGDAYLELVTVVDADAAAHSSFGRWVAASQSELLRPLGWAVRTDELDEVASRLSLTIEAGSRTGRDGKLVRWRLAGVEEAAAEPALPFFIEWAPGTQLPGRARTVDATGEVALVEIRVSGDPHRLKSWLGTHEVPIDVRRGPSGITAVILRSASGDEIVLGTTKS